MATDSTNPTQDMPAPTPHGAEAPPPHDPRIGTSLGKYRLIGRLGQGGMGVVYEAEDTALERKVAIKVLTERMSKDPELRERFQKEARAAARLNHPHVLTVYDVGNEGGTDYFVMELVRGVSAQEVLDTKGAFSWRAATRIASEICRALVAAHAASLVHRDVKPANVMIAPDGQAKLADFGLAKATGPSVVSVTGSGTILGTPTYMSPEQCRAERADEKSDLYSLGATYYALLCGKPPYPETLPVQVMFAHCSSPVPDAREANASVPERCASIVRRAMAKRPSERYPSAQAMQDELQGALGTAPGGPATTELQTVVMGDGPQGQPKRRAAWIGAAVVGLALIVGLSLHDWKKPAVVSPGGGPPAIPKSSPPGPRVSGKEIRMSGVKVPFTGHVKALAFSRQGEMFAVGAYEGEGGVTVWDLVTGDVMLRRWEGVDIHAVAFSPDGRTLAAAGEGEIRLWDFGWKAEKTVPGGAGAASIVGSLAFSEDGRTLASGVLIKSEADVTCVHISDIESGKTRGIPETCVESSSVAISPDGETLAADGGAGTLSLWRLPNGAGRRDISTGLPCINAIAFSPDGAILALSGDVSIQLWDPVKGIRLGEMKDPTGDVFCLAYSPMGDRIATAGGRVVLWDVATRAEVGVVEDDYEDAVFGIALSPDGEIAATACFDRRVRVRDISGVGR